MFEIPRGSCYYSILLSCSNKKANYGINGSVWITMIENFPDMVNEQNNTKKTDPKYNVIVLLEYL